MTYTLSGSKSTSSRGGIVELGAGVPDGVSPRVIFPWLSFDLSTPTCRHFYIPGLRTATSVGTGLPSGCRQRHDALPLGLFSFLLPSLSQSCSSSHPQTRGLGGHLAQTHLGLKQGGQPVLQGLLHRELQQHRMVFPHSACCRSEINCRS